MAKKAARVREQMIVYLEAKDRELVERLAEETGLSRTELFRRGLRRLANEVLGERKPGSAFAFLLETASESEGPADAAARHDEYLVTSGQRRKGRKRAGPG